MDWTTLQNALQRHRQQLLASMQQCESQRARLQHELAAKALQGERFEALRPLHDQLTALARDYWSAYGRLGLIDQLVDALQGRRERLAFEGPPAPAAAERPGPWARCAEETCPPFPPWA